MSIKERCEALIKQGKKNAEIAEIVKKEFKSNTSPASVAWYRNKLSKTAKKAAKKAVVKVPKKKSLKQMVADIPAIEDVKIIDGGIVAGLEVTQVLKSGGVHVKPIFYNVRKIKTFRGNEGEGYNADLYFGDKRVALVYDDASGGDVTFEWADERTEKVEVSGVNYLDQPFKYTGSLEEKRFIDYCMGLPKQANPYDKEKVLHHVSPESFVEELVNQLECEKKIKGKLVLFALPKKTGYNKLSGMKNLNHGQQRTIILKKYPTAVFLADLPIDQACRVMEGSEVL